MKSCRTVVVAGPPLVVTTLNDELDGGATIADIPGSWSSGHLTATATSTAASTYGVATSVFSAPWSF